MSVRTLDLTQPIGDMSYFFLREAQEQKMGWQYYTNARGNLVFKKAP